MLRVEVVSARQYSVPKVASDVPWLERFKADGGNVVVSGDARMRGKLHEQRALLDAGFTVFFTARRWNQITVFEKTAMLIRWWPYILEKAASDKIGRFYEIPMKWNAAKMKEVTPPSRRKPGRRKAPATVNVATASQIPGASRISSLPPSFSLGDIDTGGS
jgi:hypothetical protein